MSDDIQKAKSRLENWLRGDPISTDLVYADIRAALQRVESQEQDARNLLARIHRDGGHHTGAVGFKQSCLDAEKEWVALRHRVEEQDQLLLMVCPQCSAIAPENEKDWPDTGCVVCILRQRVEELEQGDPGLKLLFELQDSGVVQGCHSGLRPAVRELVERVEELERLVIRKDNGYTAIIKMERDARDQFRARAEAAEAKLAEAVIKLRLLPSEAAWQEGARMLQEADRARQAAEAEVERLRQFGKFAEENWQKAEAERDALRVKLEKQNDAISLGAANFMKERCIAMQAERERDDLRAEVERLRGIVRYLRGILDELDYDEAGQPITWPSMERVDNALRDTEQEGEEGK